MLGPKKILAVALSVLVFGSGMYALWLILPGPQEVHASNPTIALAGFANTGWNGTTKPNPTITVHQGDVVTLELSSGDGVTHQFLLDTDNDGSTANDCPSVDPCSPLFSSSSPIAYSFTANFAPGTYTYYCTIHPTTMVGSFVILGGSNFLLSANPTSLTLGQGNSTTSAITVSSVSGFSGLVNLATSVSPAGPTSVVSPTSVTVPSNGNSLATLTFSTTANTPGGNYNVTVTATNGTVTRIVIIHATVAQTISFTSSTIFGGANATISGRFVVNPTGRVLNSSTTLTVINATTKALIYSKSLKFNITYNTFGLANFVDDIPTSPYWYATSCTVNVPANSASCFLSRTPDLFHAGTININDVTYILAHYNTSDGLANLSATGTVNINDFTIIVRLFGTTVFLPS